MEILLVGLLMLTGLMFGVLVSQLLRMPRVVGYILAGITFAPDFLLRAAGQIMEPSWVLVWLEHRG
ncbi:hypothetical protein [Marinospirillum insulare]|uniref:Monovalent cation:H+ antiporter, CPA1 family n=1 Tax=Marinospirillum insulare TaxID=217169 RepID=A0ABQ5ZRF4_9GAMM|nr:hypothetical protein [Marinospirillum insulare]GLR62724.1 hypothetical protein GCM10007878_01590 [Marinospirillum insulare]